MSVTNSIDKEQYAGNGVTTVFSFPALFYDNSHLTVISTTGGVDTTLVISVDYTVTGVGNPAGGSVTCTVAPAVGTTLTIQRSVPLTQLNVFIANGDFPSATVEESVDLLTMQSQQAQEQLNRALSFPISEPLTTPNEVPAQAARAGQVLGFGASGEPIATNVLGTWRGNWATATLYNMRDFFRDTATNKVYVVLLQHTSTTIAADLAANKIAVLMDDSADAFDTNQVATASGTNSYTAALVPALTSLINKMQIVITFTNANTTACTLDMGPGAVSLRDNQGAALASGAIKAGMTMPLIYNAGSTQWRMTGMTTVSVTPVDGSVTPAKLSETTQKVLFNYGIATRSAGSPEPYALPLSPAITSYVDGMQVRFVPSANNAVAAPTLNVNSVGAKTLAKWSREGTNAVVNLAIGDLSTALDHIAQYDSVSDKFIVLNPAIREVMPFIKVVDSKASNTAAGGSVSSAANTYATRTLNTIVTDTHSLASLASNAVTIPAGTWKFKARAPAYNSNAHRIRLFNNTDSTAIEYSPTTFSNGSETDAVVEGVFSITTAKAIVVQQWWNTGVATNGQGTVVNDGSPEIYTTLILEQIKP